MTSAPMKLSNGAILESTTRGRHTSVLINRDQLIDRLRFADRHGEIGGAEVPKRILDAVLSCAIEGCQALRLVGCSEDLVLHGSHRWYGVHVPTGYADEAGEALQTAELHGETHQLEEMSQKLRDLADHLRKALPEEELPENKPSTETVRTSQEHELAEFGTSPPFDMCMFPLLGMEKIRDSRVLPASTRFLREIVDRIGRQFRREGRYDLAPFNVEDQGHHGVILLSSCFEATFPIAAGAAGFSLTAGSWQLDWIWLHPYERGTDHLGRAWDELETMFGQFKIDGPYSTAMKAVIRRRGISKDRLTLPGTT